MTGECQKEACVRKVYRRVSLVVRRTRRPNADCREFTIKKVSEISSSTWPVASGEETAGRKCTDIGNCRIDSTALSGRSLRMACGSCGIEKRSKQRPGRRLNGRRRNGNSESRSSSRENGKREKRWIGDQFKDDVVLKWLSREVRIPRELPYCRLTRRGWNCGVPFPFTPVNRILGVIAKGLAAKYDCIPLFPRCKHEDTACFCRIYIFWAAGRA